jgi:hypothetical protein
MQFPILTIFVGPNPGPSERLIKQFGGQVQQGSKAFDATTMNSIGKVCLWNSLICVVQCARLSHTFGYACVCEYWHYYLVPGGPKKATTKKRRKYPCIAKSALSGGTRSCRLCCSDNCRRSTDGSHGSDISAKCWRMEWRKTATT